MNRNALLIYDGDCAFCKNSLRLAIKYLPDLPRYAAYQKLDLETLGLNLNQVQAQVWLIDGPEKARWTPRSCLDVQSPKKPDLEIHRRIN
jgi:hypothetical protein